MDSRNIVRKAWQITQVYLKKLIWYGSIPAFFNILVSSTYLTYQFNAFRHSALFNPEEDQNILGTANTVWEVVREHPKLSVSLIIIAAIIFACYSLLPPIFNGMLISAVTRIHDYHSFDGVAETGVRRFFPMFEFRALMGAFSITTLFTESSFILRWWGESIFYVVLPFLLFIAIVGFIMSILFTYSEFFIVLDNKGIIGSISESCVLVIANIRKTILIFILTLLIGVRAILNVILVLLIPFLIVVLTSYFATLQFALLGIILGIGVGIVLSTLAAYLLGLFHIFTTTVWVLTFKEITQKATSQPEKTEPDQKDPQAEIQPQLPILGITAA